MPEMTKLEGTGRIMWERSKGNRKEVSVALCSVVASRVMIVSKVGKNGKPHDLVFNSKFAASTPDLYLDVGNLDSFCV